MKIKSINPWKWQDHFGYVQANLMSEHQKTLFISGQISVDENGTPLFGGDIVSQLEKCFDNLSVVLEQAGADFTNITRLTYYTDVILVFLYGGPWPIRPILIYSINA